LGIGNGAAVTGATVAAAQREGASGVTRLGLLGGFELTRDREQITLPLAVQRLVAFLGLHEKPLARLYVAGVLWPDSNEDRSRANLRAVLSRLRRTPVSVIDASTTHLRLHPHVLVDVRRLETTLRRFLQDRLNDSPLELHQQDQSLSDLFVAGDLLPDWYDDWISDERDRLHQLRLQVLDVLADQLMKAEEFDLAATAALAAVRAEPLRESSQRTLIRLHIAQGNRAAARRCYRTYCRRLHSEEGVSPSNKLTELVATLEGA
jgi:DNA-binding SARP family transcriptional activator